MIDPDDPKQAKRYRESGIAFIISIGLVLLILTYLAAYIYINELF